LIPEIATYSSMIGDGKKLRSSRWADTGPLFRLISRCADAGLLAAIAREYRKGRLLLIGTTNLDQQRPIIWNIGAIAASGQPGALDLFRKILLASASIPGAFPPVMIDVEARGIGIKRCMSTVGRWRRRS
jgi:predicted acylesterase/phospholipase RssA